jgi:hypothetical protein
VKSEPQEESEKTMSSKFDELVQNLEAPMLEELRRSVASELSERRAHSSIQMEQIHAEMSNDDKLRAMQEIGRVLRGEEGHA